MSDDTPPIPERPRLRAVEARAVSKNGEQAFFLRDPLRLSPYQALVPLPFFALATLFDGNRTLREIQEEFSRRFGAAVLIEQVEEVVRELDKAMFIEGPRIEAAVAQWRKQPLREPACAGGSYPADPAALRGFLDAQFTRQGGPGGAPDGTSSKGPVRVVVSPHIDFHRGGHAYAWAWRAVAEASEAELFVVFGTAHAGTGRARFALTRKDYVTPIGTVPTDQQLIDRLLAAYGGEDDLFEGELAHRGEHSIEFQMVELAHLFSGKRDVRVLPVLCGSLHDLIEPLGSPGGDARLRAFHDALEKALEPVPPERVAFVAGVDLAHVGREFDDPPLDEAGLARILADDEGTLAALTEAQDAELLHRDVAHDQDARKICGHSALVATLEAARRQRGGRWTALSGELLCHDRWYDGASTVSFASAVLRASGGAGGGRS